MSRSAFPPVAAVLSRRALLVALAAGGLAGCQTGPLDVALAPPVQRFAPEIEAMYAGFEDGGFEIDPLDLSGLNAEVFRQLVPDPTGEAPGTIVVDTGGRRLYLVQEGGRALRYGIGVGREGLAWAGRAYVARKAAWPRWTPTETMIRRDPRNAEWAGGMEGGPENPLGARALYLYRDGRDTMYRLHGTNDPSSIGEAVSSGCIRLFNHDIIDLHRRVPNGTNVVVLPPGRSLTRRPGLSA